MITGIIYCHKNKVNNKVYIGSTIQTPNRRWRKGTMTSYKSCPAFFRALKKYGWDIFETVILEENVLFDNISKREEYYINQYNCIAPNGYNTNKLIEGRVKFSEKTKDKISKARIKYIESLIEPIIAYNRKKHIFINNIEHKECSLCKHNKVLINFGKDLHSWDNLNRYCKECQNNRKRPSQKILTKEQLKESYRLRSIKMRETIINNYKTKPEIREKQAKIACKPLKAIHIETGETLYFSSALEAKKHSFDNTNISNAINQNKPYRKYKWSFDK